MRVILKVVEYTVEIIILAMFVVFLSLNARNAKEQAESAQTEVLQMTSQLDNIDLAVYKNGKFEGRILYDIIKDLQRTYVVRVYTKMVPTGFTDINSSVSSRDPKYLNPSANFLSYVQYDANGNVLEIRFVQEGV